MNYKLIPIFLAFVIGLLFLSSNASAFPQNACIVPLDGCDTETNIIDPQYCHYTVDANAFTADYKRIDIEVNQGGMLNSDRDHSFIFDTTSESFDFTVWVDKHTQPTYILCYGLDAGNERHALDQVVLGNANVSVSGEPTYEELTTDDPELLFIGIGFILISLISMYLIAMED